MKYFVVFATFALSVLPAMTPAQKARNLRFAGTSASKLHTYPSQTHQASRPGCTDTHSPPHSYDPGEHP